MLLCSLPVSPSYENLVTTLMWGKETLKLEEVTGALLSFHQRKKANEETAQGEGLVAKGNQERGRSKARDGSNNKKSRSKSRKKTDDKCYLCRKSRHLGLSREQEGECREQRRSNQVCKHSSRGFREQ